MKWAKINSLGVAGFLGLQTLLSGAVLAQPLQPPAFANPAFQRVWERTDKPVADDTVDRTWFWGPNPNTAATNEDNKESPDGRRLVQYFDKSRMEINNPNANPNDPFYVTNGLLTVELISGKVQTGANTFEQSYSACIPVTGDSGNETAPTYAGMWRVSNTSLGDHPAPSLIGQPVTATISGEGEVGTNPSQTAVKNAYYENLTKHNIPDVFWTFLNQSGPVYENGQTRNAQLISPWFYASGLPISEAYWSRAPINGAATDVLVQMYERRVLTYVPSNPNGFKVEMSNIGQHYHDWRYENAGRCSPLASGEISFQVFGEPAEVDVFKAVVSSYNEYNPDVKVNLVAIPAQGDHLTKLATSFAAGNPPDMFLLNYRRYGQFADQNVLESLGDKLAQSGMLNASDYYTPSMEAFTYNGTLQCIPQNISSLAVYYNKNLFEQNNVPLPTATWTWDNFVNAAKQLTKDTNGDGKPDVYGVGVDTQLIRLAPFVWQNGGEIVDNYTKPTKLTIDTPEGKEAFQWFVDLNQKHKVSPTKAEITSQAGGDRFLNGTLGMWLGSRADTPTFRTIKNFTWDVAPLPAGDAPGTILHSDGYCMAAQSKNKDATWDFIQFALGPQGQVVASKLGRIVPSLKSVANSPAYLDPAAPPANSKMWLDVIPTIRRVPISPVWGAVESAVNAEIDRAYYGAATVDQAIQAATQKANAEFAKVK